MKLFKLKKEHFPTSRGNYDCQERIGFVDSSIHCNKGLIGARVSGAREGIFRARVPIAGQSRHHTHHFSIRFIPDGGWCAIVVRRKFSDTFRIWFEEFEFVCSLLYQMLITRCITKMGTD